MDSAQNGASGRLAISLVILAALAACRADAVGSATLSWSPPTQNTDGSPIARLAGYNIYYGTSPNALSITIPINNPATTAFIVRNLSPGTYYFTVTAYTASGEESRISAVVAKTIR